MTKLILILAIAVILIAGVTALQITLDYEAEAKPPKPPKPPMKQEEVGDPEVLAVMQSINKQLEEMGLNIAVEEIEFFTIGEERPLTRIHQQSSQWVPNDARRGAAGNDITYLVDQSDGATSSSLTSAQTEAAIDRAMSTWQADRCLQKVNIIKQTDTGADPDIFDGFFGFGIVGNSFLADITNAGWLPRAFFEAVDPGSGDTDVAFTVTFIFVGASGPTDINGDNYLDIALKEVYYNDSFGNVVTPRAGNPWGINTALPGIDVETVALHENGHSLGIGHFGPPPTAVMNPVYAGIRQAVSPIDQAGMCTVWASWPNR